MSSCSTLPKVLLAGVATLLALGLTEAGLGLVESGPPNPLPAGN